MRDRLARRKFQQIREIQKWKTDYAEWQNAWRECNGMLTRSQIREVQCPKCGAEKGEICISLGGKQRRVNHMERLEIRAEKSKTRRPMPPSLPSFIMDKILR